MCVTLRNYFTGCKDLPPRRKRTDDDKEDKAKEQSGDSGQQSDFPYPKRTINNIYRGSATQESQRKQKLRNRDIFAIGAKLVEILKWSETPITFFLRKENPAFYRKLIRYKPAGGTFAGETS